MAAGRTQDKTYISQGHTQHPAHNRDKKDAMPHRAQGLPIARRFFSRPQTGTGQCSSVVGPPSHSGAHLQQDAGHGLQGCVTSVSGLCFSGCIFWRPGKARAGILLSIPRTLVKLKRRNSQQELTALRLPRRPPAGSLPPLKPVANSSLFLSFQGQGHIGRKGSLCSPASDSP